ncbi:MAG TPA: hypothetical protein VKZ91_03330 [Woeseiaceae bacterium]|nr:hypothetical protein [Woeseiaceae bacterium]
MTNERTTGETAASQAPAATPPKIESLNARRQSTDQKAGPGRRQVASEDLDLIVRRAAEIQNKRGNGASQMLTDEEVVEIGRQVGLEPAHVRRAMAEVHAESLAPKPPQGNRILDLVAGDARVEVRRVVAGEPTLIQQQVEMLLREREKLSALRRRPTRSVWEASAGIMDRLDRFMNFSGKEYALAETRQVELAVAETEPGWSLVTLAADLSNKREEVLYTAGSCVGVAAILAAAFAAMEGGGIFFSVVSGVFVGLVSVAVAVPWLRWSVGKRRERTAVILEGLIDQVDR